MTVLRIRIGRWRLVVGWMPVTVCEGVYSNLENGKHVLMWDFDDIPIEHVRAELRRAQNKFYLPRIYVLNSGKKDHWLAYCFSRTSFEQAKEILASCHSIDASFYSIGVTRERWCLRISPKSGRAIKLQEILESDILEDCKINELKQYCTYETSADGYKNKQIEV